MIAHPWVGSLLLCFLSVVLRISTYSLCKTSYALVSWSAVEQSMLLCRGDFKPWSKEELQDMKDAGDKEAHKLVQRSHAKGHGSKVYPLLFAN